jgi:hypothetical protein
MPNNRFPSRRGLLSRSVLAAGTAITRVASGATPVTARTVVEDFDSYASDKDLATAWYVPPHGNWLRQTRETVHKAGGKFSVKVEYKTTAEKGKNYAAFCRVHPWNLAGHKGIEFWWKPDGSGRLLTFEMNIADREGKNIHDLWSKPCPAKRGDTKPRLERIAFSSLVQNTKYADSPDVSPIFKPADVIEIAFYISAKNATPGDGVFYIDDIVAV